MTGRYRERSPLINSDAITVTHGDPTTDLGLSGLVNAHPQYLFQAKVFDRESRFGIENGRVSKLEVSHSNATVMRYSRGWDRWPRSQEQFEVLRAILEGFPKADDGQLARTSREHAHWVVDGENMSLFVGGDRAAEVHNALNSVALPADHDSGPGQESAPLLLPLKDCALDRAEAQFPDLRTPAILDPKGRELTGKRLELKFRADYWQLSDYLAEDSVPTAAQLLYLAQQVFGDRPARGSSGPATEEALHHCATVSAVIAGLDAESPEPYALSLCSAVAQTAASRFMQETASEAVGREVPPQPSAGQASARAAVYCSRAADHLRAGAALSLQRTESGSVIGRASAPTDGEAMQFFKQGEFDVPGSSADHAPDNSTRPRRR